MSDPAHTRPGLACYVLLRRGNEVLFVLRQNAGWMDGYYGLPAGRAEPDEPGMLGAVREALEETGVTIDVSKLRHAVTVHRRSEEADWIDLYFEADSWEDEIYNAEPEKHSSVEWLSLDKLPENLIPTLRAALDAINEGKTYIEFGWENS